MREAPDKVWTEKSEKSEAIFWNGFECNYLSDCFYSEVTEVDNNS